MTVQKLNIFHTVCELERNEPIAILAMSQQNPFSKTLVFPGISCNFLYIEGSTDWLCDCPHFLCHLFKADRCFDSISIQFKDTLMLHRPNYKTNL